MFVDRKKILLGNIGSGATINITLGSDFFPVDNSELIEDKFVNDEVKKSINPIIDYKKVIFKPADKDWELLRKFKINLNFYVPSTITPPPLLHRGSGSEPGVYGDIGFVFDDVFCRTNRFVNSFIRLFFFDTPNSGTNSVLSITDIYNQVGKDQENEFGFTKPIDSSPITFTIGDPILEPNEVNEGFQMYWYKDLVDNSPNGEYTMYMTLQYNHAGNGKIYTMGASKSFNPHNITLSELEGENGILYLKVILKNHNGIYKYRFEPNTKQSNVPPGVILNPTNGGIPTLTFWQITP